MNTHVDLSPNWQVKFGRTKGFGLEKDMAQEKRHGAGRKGHGAGKKRGMARRHAKRGWGKHYISYVKGLLSFKQPGISHQQCSQNMGFRGFLMS